MSIIQAVLFDKNYFSTTRLCRDWLNEAEIDYIKPAQKTENYIQYKIVEPEPYFNKGYRFRLRNIDLGSGIELIMMEPEKHIKYLEKYHTI
jgi:hypothetical protein